MAGLSSVMRSSGLVGVSMSSWTPLYLLTYGLLHIATALRGSAPREYCEAETFRAKCNSDEVVVMELAEYGRMDVGRCVIKDYGYVGCKADVMEHMDNKCSGRRGCEIRIPDTTLDRANPCPKDFKTYLKAGYKCKAVHNPACRPCRNVTDVIAESPEGVLASIMTEESNCGSVNCPYLLRAKAGQRFNITLMDFALSTKRRSTVISVQMGLPEFCYRYATIREKTREKDTIVCGGTERDRHVYLSDSHLLEIQMASGKHGGAFGHFLLKYEVLGCADYERPGNTWVKREGDQMTLGCVSTGQVWTLHCEHKQWVGDIDECPPGAPEPSGSADSSVASLPLGILVAIILAIAMIIGVFILTCGLVFIKRRRMAASAPAQPAADSQSDAYYKGHYSQYSTASRGRHIKEYSTTKTSDSGWYEPGFMNTRENDYGYNHATMELRPLPSLPDVNEATKNTIDQNNVCPSQDCQHSFHNGQHLYYAPKNARGEEELLGPHYFELDPEVDDINDGSFVVDGRNGMDVRYMTSHPQHPLIPRQKSPEQENAENIGKEVCSFSTGSSCHDLPAMISPANNNPPPYKETGTCSWP